MDEQRVKESPKSREAEQAVIGGLLIDNEAWERVADRVQASDFFYQNHRVIFKAMVSLANKGQPFDVVTIPEALRIHDELETAGGLEYLRELGIETPSAINVVAYADIVRERAVLRQLIATSGEIANSAYFPEGRDVKTLLDNAEQRVFAIADQFEKNDREGFQPIKNVAAETVTYVMELAKRGGNPVTGIPTGFTDLDEQTAGLQPGDLVIVAGRPSMGKTTFAMNIAENVALETNKPVAIFALEMPARSLVLRMMASLGKIESSKLRVGKMDSQMLDKMASVASQISHAPIFIDDSSNLSPTELRARCRRLQRDEGQLGLVVIDYLQLMQLPDSSENRATQISDISRALKLLAKELDVPVIALSQLNRSLESRPNKRPIMSDIRESGAIEQDADVIMFVYRDEVYDENSKQQGIAEIIIGKQRNGPIGTVHLAFIGQYTCFDNLSPDYHLYQHDDGE
ncbi:replicative DNA helicase [Suttonella sp. R2A3]|uniref:replicative DNA helicase n=1 Tax=Suttonella sp. R2A3 TaxID=2908648 RepID=UPI001F41B520|nr:replicative DNA helicase [Suttonella sp. R2A3]UJF24300.1 replicative DNA helicase [Suttonella sp. R2A3]